MDGTGDHIIKGIRVRKTNMYMLSRMYNLKLYVFHTHNVYEQGGKEDQESDIEIHLFI